jgi:hypothetical protein
MASQAPSITALRLLAVAGRAIAFCVAIASATTMSQPKWADPAKSLRVTMDGGEAGFDPQAAGDIYSFTVVSAIFDELYQYDERWVRGLNRDRVARLPSNCNRAVGPTLVLHVGRHTHCLTDAWFDLLQRARTALTVKASRGCARSTGWRAAMTPVPLMFDYDLRLKTIDVAWTSESCLTCELLLGRP